MKRNLKNTLSLFLLVMLGIIAGCSRDEQPETAEKPNATTYVKSFYNTDFSYGRTAGTEAQKPASSVAKTAKAEDYSVTEIIVGNQKEARGYIITDKLKGRELYFVDVNRATKKMTIVELETKETISVNNIDKLDEYKETNGFDFIKIAEDAVSEKAWGKGRKFWGWGPTMHDGPCINGEKIIYRIYYVFWLDVGIRKPEPDLKDNTKPLKESCGESVLGDD